MLVEEEEEEETGAMTTIVLDVTRTMSTQIIER